jgi:hypothetical protein
MIPAGRQHLVVLATATPTKEDAKPKVESAAPAKGSGAAPAAVPVPQPVIEDKGIELAWPAPRPWAEVFLSKIVDTVEDVGVIARRTFNDNVPGCVHSWHCTPHTLYLHATAGWLYATEAYDCCFKLQCYSVHCHVAAAAAAAVFACAAAFVCHTLHHTTSTLCSACLHDCTCLSYVLLRCLPAALRRLTGCSVPARVGGCS